MTSLPFFLAYIVLETFDFRDGVVGRVQFFEVHELFQALEARQSIALNTDNSEVLQCAQVLLLIVSRAAYFFSFCYAGVPRIS